MVRDYKISNSSPIVSTTIGAGTFPSDYIFGPAPTDWPSRTNLVNPHPNYKYSEGDIIADFHKYIDDTYSGHYQTEEEEIQAFDAWIALGDATPTFRNTAIKYLWRYGKKDGPNKKDLYKVLHYTLMMLYNDHYKVEHQKAI